MLYWLAEWLGFPGALNLIRYLSFRSGAAVATALIIGLWIGPRFILMLRMRQGKGQPIRDDGPQSHLAKKGTPTMGGLMILIALMISALLWMDLSNPSALGRESRRERVCQYMYTPVGAGAFKKTNTKRLR